MPGVAPTSIDDRLSIFLSDTGLQQHVNVPTRQDKTSSNILDLIITQNDSSFIQNMSVDGVPFSDHALISVTVRTVSLKNNTRTFNFRNLRSVD